MADNNVAAKGSFHKGDKKTQRSPDYIGSVTTQADIKAGTKLWVGVWKNIGDNGEPYWSTNLTFPQEQQQQSRGGYQQNRQAPQRQDNYDDL